MKRLRIIKTDRTALFDDDDFDDDNYNVINKSNQDTDLGSNTWYIEIHGSLLVSSVILFES